MKYQYFFRIFRFFIFVIICINISLTFFSERSQYLSKTYWDRYPGLQKAYYDSIYANKKGTWLNDKILYSFAGGAFMKGVNPVLINPEVSPLGRYIIGLSTVLFNNENVLNGFFVIMTLFLTYIISRQVVKSKTVALLPIFFLSFEPIFKNQIINTPLLDIMHAVFLLLFFYLFNKSLKSPQRSLLSIFLANCALGCFIATKFYILGLPIVIASIIVLINNKLKKHFLQFILTLPIAIGILLSTYIQAIITGYPVSDFLGIQKWIFIYNSGHMQYPFSVWPLLMFNYWYVWWGNIPVLSDPQWFISWPILVIFTFLTLFLYLKKLIRTNKAVEILLVWVFAYLLMLSTSDASTRYFVILIPVLYIITIFCIEEIVNKLLVSKKFFTNI